MKRSAVARVAVELQEEVESTGERKDVSGGSRSPTEMMNEREYKEGNATERSRVSGRDPAQFQPCDDPAFREYYTQVFGEGTFERLWQACTTPLPTVVRVRRSPTSAAQRMSSSQPCIYSDNNDSNNDVDRTNIQEEEVVSWLLQNEFEELTFFNAIFPQNCGRLFRLKDEYEYDNPARSIRDYCETQNRCGTLQFGEAASMIPIIVLQASAGHSVLDLCAAPGNKSLALLDLVGPSGCVFANELNFERGCLDLTRNVQKNNERGLNSCCHIGDGKYCYRKFLPHTFDRVVCDTPCSADGTIRKSPLSIRFFDPNYVLTKKSSKLQQTQIQLLLNSIFVTKVGGRVVYSTCSFNPKENEEVVEFVLNVCGQDALRLVNVAEVLGDNSGRLVQPGLSGKSMQLPECGRVLPGLVDDVFGGFFVCAFDVVSDISGKLYNVLTQRVPLRIDSIWQKKVKSWVPFTFESIDSLRSTSSTNNNNNNNNTNSTSEIAAEGAGEGTTAVLNTSEAFKVSVVPLDSQKVRRSLDDFISAEVERQLFPTVISPQTTTLFEFYGIDIHAVVQAEEHYHLLFQYMNRTDDQIATTTTTEPPRRVVLCKNQMFEIVNTFINNSKTNRVQQEMTISGRLEQQPPTRLLADGRPDAENSEPSGENRSSKPKPVVSLLPPRFSQLGLTLFKRERKDGYMKKTMKCRYHLSQKAVKPFYLRFMTKRILTFTNSELFLQLCCDLELAIGSLLRFAQHEDERKEQTASDQGEEERPEKCIFGLETFEDQLGSCIARLDGTDHAIVCRLQGQKLAVSAKQTVVQEIANMVGQLDNRV